MVGDTHGNADWLHDYIYPVALTLSCDKIVVLGDFGAWEHMRHGVHFMDEVNDLGADTGVRLYWLHGNHDNATLVLEMYGDQRDDEGFILVRKNVLYIPQGHSWTWASSTFRSFGGAYSIDKQMRLAMEERRADPGSLWFPEEQMSDAEMDELLSADADEKDFVLSHDKPLSSRPNWNRKDISGCAPNQIRLQKALEVHRPTYWLHGHLHFRYTDVVRTAASRPFSTTVIGLEPDKEAAEPGWKHKHTWALVELHGDQPDIVTPGEQVSMDTAAYQQAKLRIF